MTGRTVIAHFATVGPRPSMPRSPRERKPVQVKPRHQRRPRARNPHKPQPRETS